MTDVNKQNTSAVQSGADVSLMYTYGQNPQFMNPPHTIPHVQPQYCSTPTPMFPPHIQQSPPMMNVRPPWIDNFSQK